MNIDWEDIKTVLYLVKGGSLAKAGAQLGVNYTTVARRISRLENALDQQLFLKAKAGYIATEAGLRVAEAAEGMEKQDHSLRRYLMAAQEPSTGLLTVTAPPLLVGPYLAKVIKMFNAAHPNVGINIRATNSTLDLNKPEADIAIRVSNTPDENLVGQRLAKQRVASFASAELAQALQDDPGATIRWLGMTYWTSPPKASLKHYPNAEIAFRFDDMSALIGAVQNGLGVARLPMFLGNATNGLVQVPILQPQSYWDIWVLTHNDLRTAPKITAFKEILIPYFKKKAPEFWGEAV